MGWTGGEARACGQWPHGPRAWPSAATHSQVCNERFDDIAATVVCRQLGLPTPGRMLGPGYFGAGASTSRIWLTGVACSGDETRLPDCPHNTWGTRVASCTHAKVGGLGGARRFVGRSVQHVNQEREPYCSSGLKCTALGAATGCYTPAPFCTTYTRRMWALHVAWRPAFLPVRAQAPRALVGGELLCSTHVWPVWL